MSRYGDYDDGPEYNNAGDLWERAYQNALRGKRGQQALRDLREALLALPEKRLISRAMCTMAVKVPEQPPAPIRWDDAASFSAYDENRHILDMVALVGEVGKGVCAVGAYLWWKKVKAGEDPQAAFESLPVLEDTNHDLSETGYEAKKVGMAGVLAWNLAYRNDETFGDLSPERRYTAFLEWIDKELAA